MAARPGGMKPTRKFELRDTHGSFSGSQRFDMQTSLAGPRTFSLLGVLGSDVDLPP